MVRIEVRYLNCRPEKIAIRMKSQGGVELGLREMGHTIQATGTQLVEQEF